MLIKTSTTIGGVTYEFTFDEKDEMETLHKASVLSNPKTKCDECGNTGKDNFKLDSNKDKESNVYVNVVCRKCGAKSKLGQYKSGGYFWRNFEKWQSPNTDPHVPNISRPHQNEKVGKIDVDDLPF